MLCSWKTSLKTFLAAALLMTGGFTIGSVVTATEAAAVTFTDMRGNWRGWGWVELQNGGRERVRCRVSYQPQSSSRMSQSLRCASTTYKIDAETNLRRQGNAISGQWRENSFNVTGTLQGRPTTNGFQLSLDGDIFSAGMSVQVSRCDQSLNINVRGIEIRKVSMTLKRC